MSTGEQGEPFCLFHPYAYARSTVRGRNIIQSAVPLMTLQGHPSLSHRDGSKVCIVASAECFAAVRKQSKEAVCCTVCHKVCMKAYVYTSEKHN